jgi:hypothetical protein
MRIVGGKDYYDHGLAFGVDQSLVFVRTGTKLYDYLNSGVMPSRWGTAPGVVVNEKAGAVPARRSWPDRTEGTSWWHKGITYYVDGVGVVFCGHYYGGARVRSYPPPGEARDHHPPMHLPTPGYGIKWHTETFWDQNTLGKYLGKHGASVATARTKGLAAYRQGSAPEHRAFYRAPLPKEMLALQIEAGVAVATRCAEDHDRQRRKGFTHEQDEYFWRVNEDTLKHFDFVKLVNPVQAFQQLSMWVGGVLPQPGAKMVEITDDKVKAHKAGFDQFSFKRMPTKVR